MMRKRKLEAVKRFDEYFNVLRTSIINNNGQQTPRVIMVTSCQRGEGVSTVVSNLAMSISQNSNDKVLVVDGNLKSPSMHTVFDVPRSPNLNEFMNNSVANKSLAISKNHRVWVLPASGDDSEAPASYSFPKIGNLFERLKGIFDYIVVDAPSLVANEDFNTNLARIVDGVILVIEAEKTRWEVAQRMKEKLAEKGANILGVVLNKRKYYIPRWLYKTL